MKTNKNIILVFFLFAFSAVGLSQQPPATKLNKNRNDKANGLTQRLNKVADTLFLSSDKDILRVNFLSHATKEKLQVDVGAQEVNVPLYHFGKGRYTIAVYRVDKIIAFDINRIQEILMPDGASDNLEESLLRASLSEEEQADRGMEPAPAKKKEVVAEAKPKPKPKVKPKSRPKPKPPKVAAVEDNGPSEREIKRKLLEEKKKAVAELNKQKESERQKRLEEIKSKPKTSRTKKMTYNLSKHQNDSIVRQSREEYRKNNLRPNGKPYD